MKYTFSDWSDWQEVHTCRTNQRSSNGVCIDCVSPQANGCTGDKECASGFEGEFCGICPDGTFLSNFECESCPDYPVDGIFLSLVVIIIGFLIIKLQRKSFIIASIFCILVNAFQIGLINFQFDISTPRIFKVLEKANDSGTLNPDVAYADCYHDLSFYEKWGIIGIWIPSLVVLCLCLILKIQKRKLNRALKIENESIRFNEITRIDENRATAYRVLTVLVTIGYFLVMSTLLDVFICHNDDDVDISVLVNDQSISCDTDTHSWAVILSAFLFTIGLIIPVKIGFDLWKRVRKNQLGDGMSYGSMGAFYRPFKDKYAYFQTISILRKTLVVLILKVFYDAAETQLIASFIVNLFYGFIVFSQSPFITIARPSHKGFLKESTW
eukprot:TRINITY_DN4051_c0_g2_i1.p1 TRINITY_DN4051_c0_g2~~TRINITY_DN4051_c0_g2_i1.p1  ORF type:complete len:448 (+),score=99.07 TRINITY_DN4051_c0_g2_i1:196-1344(+)